MSDKAKVILDDALLRLLADDECREWVKEFEIRVVPRQQIIENFGKRGKGANVRDNSHYNAGNGVFKDAGADATKRD
jgi:hypothetical protein